MNLGLPSWANRILTPSTVLIVMGLSGCQSWHSTGGLPGLNAKLDERAIVKKAQNDPFPSPQQVGLK
jgi:hypothetical protein